MKILVRNREKVIRKERPGAEVKNRVKSIGCAVHKSPAKEVLTL